MLNILSGYETANTKSLAVKAGEVIADGTWVVFDGTTGKVKAQTGNFDGRSAVAFPTFGGNDVRFDSKQMAVVSVPMGKGWVGETDKFAAVTINAGNPLTVVDGVLTNVLSLTGATPTNSVMDVVAYAITDNSSGVLQFVRA